MRYALRIASCRSMVFPLCSNHHTTFLSSFLQKIHDFPEVLFCLLENRQHTVAMHHLRTSGHRIRNFRSFAGVFKIRQCAIKHLVSRIEEMNIAYAGKISPGAREHIVRHIALAMAHELLTVSIKV